MPKVKIRPLDDRVVVEPVEAEERTAGGSNAGRSSILWWP